MDFKQLTTLRALCIDTRCLVDFVVAAIKQNLTGAAREFGDVQPNTSRNIRKLEDRLGVRLFERKGSCIALNENGRFLLEKIRGPIGDLAHVVNSVKAGTQRQTLHVGYAPSLAGQLLPKTIEILQRNHPNIHVELHDLSSADCMRQLQSGDLDVALMVEPSKRSVQKLSFEKITSMERYCVVPSHHQFAEMKSVSLEEVKNQRFLGYSRKEYPEYRERLRQIFRACGGPPSVAEEYDSATSLIAAVEAGRGIALIPTSLKVGPNLKLLPIYPEPPPILIGAVYTTPLSKQVNEYIIAAKHAASEFQPARVH